MQIQHVRVICLVWKQLSDQLEDFPDYDMFL
jgi:hypothetical protein